MCKCLKISRAGYYKWVEKQEEKDQHANLVVKLFNENRKAYGTRRLKVECAKHGVVLSRRRIGKIMKDHNIQSVYTKAKFKASKSTVNEENIENIVDRKFNGRQRSEVLVSDLTYVRVGNTWNYICTIIDLYNREIIGYSCGEYKTAQLVIEAFSKIPTNLKYIDIFHTDRGKEFKNKAIDALLSTFGVTRSLSHKGTPYDNAVAEATYKTIKTEFVSQKKWETLEQLKSSFKAYVWWYNHKRLHSSLGYRSPIEHDKIANL